MKSRVLRVAPLLFGSGLTSLVYQVAWMREMRLIFGFSTAASAAVVAIFMGALGLGSWLLGRRADAARRPLLFYGRLELAIAASAALTPGLIWLARQAYVAVGGSFALGPALGTAARLLLSALVLCVPTVLMGGTLPAATRAVESDEDSSRRGLALLYGVNTLGAVAGTAAATFWLLELAGTRATLWLACGVNLLVALLAIRMGRNLAVATVTASEREAARTRAAPRDSPERAGLPPPAFVLSAAAVSGFAFLLMELVWYRMLAPLLGGSTYTFGLVLAVALAGIGFGGVSYALWGRRRPATLAGLAATFGLEAACLALPYALGDSVALFAVFRRSMGALGLSGQVLGWTEVTALLVFPASFVAGFQFPLLVALLGRGLDQVGRHVGLAYASNTAGAIMGSLAGGFGLIPILTATGAWAGVVILLVVMALWAAVLSANRERKLGALLVPAAALAASLVFMSATGPTAAWRHSPIGAGRIDLHGSSRNGLTDWLRSQRRALSWEADGRESSVAVIRARGGLAFAINGKVDGSSRSDAATQVMGGLLGCALHPSPRRALVVGLGTGSTAGWMGAIASVERVDVVELEGAIRQVARDCSPVNQNVLANPKVKLLIGDAREFLLTSRQQYDVVFSEPSNPYRAGISSLFTREFYEAVRSRLSPGGIFLQWLQAYEVDGQTVKTTYATLASVLPSVETWFTKKDDLILVASREPIRYGADTLRARLSEEPYRSALLAAWGVAGLEGFLSHYVGAPALARAIAGAEAGRVNTDDRNRVEFGFARSVGASTLFQSDELRRLARERREDRPPVEGGDVDWTEVERQRLSSLTAEGETTEVTLPENERLRPQAHAAFLRGELGQVRATWLAGGWEPSGPVELAMAAEALADGGDEMALAHSRRLREFQPAEADAVAARFLWSQGKWKECYLAAAAAFQRYRSDPWPSPLVMERLIAVVVDLPSKDVELAPPVYDLLAAPFSLRLLDEERMLARVTVAEYLTPDKAAEALQALEPHFPWQPELLELRARIYEETGNPRAAIARRELARALESEPPDFSRGLDSAAGR